VKDVPPALPPLGRSPVYAPELVFQVGYLLPDPPAVHLELGFARPPRSDAARLPREVLPESPQTGQGIDELRDLDLDSRLPRSRAPDEDVENHLGSIDDVHVEPALDVSRLRGREIVVEYDEVDIFRVDRACELLELSRADECRPVDARPVLDGAPHHLCRGRPYEHRELAEIFHLILVRFAG